MSAGSRSGPIADNRKPIGTITPSSGGLARWCYGLMVSRGARTKTVVDKVAVAIVRTSELNAASEQVSAPGRKDRLKVLSTLVAAARHPAAASEP